jgi:hypothetical protein
MATENGKAKGGAARAESLTPERRKQISAIAVAKKKHMASLPKSSHRGELKIGDMEIACCVLGDGRRLISEGGIASILGSTGGKSYKLRDSASDSDIGPMPLFLASKALQPFIHNVFEGLDLSLVEYVENGKISLGYEATILPKVCEVWLRAKESGTLQQSQLAKAKKAEILIRGLAHLGIVALVDEATGYQRDRAKDALAKILEAFVAKELQPWIKTFPTEYYEQLFRLYGYPFPPENKPQWRPQFFGTITNEVVYNRLAPDLLPELKKAANKAEKKARLHQWLSQEIGHPKLREHLASLITLMKLSKNPEEWRQLVDRIHPRQNSTLPLNFEENQY